MNLPYGATVSRIVTPDGDQIIDSVKYPTNDGKLQTVKYDYNIDGDRVPVTGHTIDGDHYFPKAIIPFYDI